MTLRQLLIASLLTVTAGAWAAPIKYTVLSKGEKIGTYVEETTGNDKEGFVDESTLTITRDGHKMTIHEISHYGKDGIDSSKSAEITVEEHEIKLKANLSDDGAKVTGWMDNDKQEKDVPLATKTTRADPTNFWWKGVIPEEGKEVTYQSFDLHEAKWSDVTLKFIGKKKIKLHDKEVEVNEISRVDGDQKSTVYVDDKGDAVLVEQDDLRIERDEE